MLVAQYTVPSGEVFVSADHGDDIVKATLNHVPAGTRVELIIMTEEEYNGLPSTSSSARFFELTPEEYNKLYLDRNQ